MPNAVGNSRPGVGVEERNFSQDEDSVTHLAALRVQVSTWISFASLCAWMCADGYRVKVVTSRQYKCSTTNSSFLYLT